MLNLHYTCSLGCLCHSSNLLKRNNLKLCSYPFDWIFSDCDNIIHCIENNFKIFLDKSYYNGIDKDKCEHTYYKKEGGLNMFNHHNPLENINHYNYFVRCVDRFRILLQKQEHKLFTMIFVNIDNIDNYINKIIDFNNKFSKHTSNYMLLVIFHIPHKQQHYHNFTYHDNIHFLELHTLLNSNGVTFNNNNDNIYLDNIIKSNYNLIILK